MCDRHNGFAHPLCEQLEEPAQALVVQGARGLDDARGLATMGRLQDPREVLDLSAGKEWAKWWIGGRMNIVQSCLDRHRDREFHDKVALIWEGEPGEVRRLT